MSFVQGVACAGMSALLALRSEHPPQGRLQSWGMQAEKWSRFEGHFCFGTERGCDLCTAGKAERTWDFSLECPGYRWNAL